MIIAIIICIAICVFTALVWKGRIDVSLPGVPIIGPIIVLICVGTGIAAFTLLIIMLTRMFYGV
jgi:hypothetical protein